MKRLILTLIILFSMIVGTLLGGAYVQHKLADKFDLVTAMVNDIDRMIKEACNASNR
jgi:hypothetical protein